VETVAISPDGTLLVSGGCDETIKLWSLSDGALLKTLTGHGGTVCAVAISPDGTLLASASDDKTIKLWSFPDGALLKTLTAEVKVLTAWPSVWAAVISPDGAALVSGGSDQIVRLWSLPDGILRSSLMDPKCSYSAGVTCSPYGGPRDACTCDSVCVCESVCTCNTVCTCDSQSGSSCGGSYYYPD
jgi:WD40 repeat protein